MHEEIYFFGDEIYLEIIQASIEHLDCVYELICELVNECLNKDAFSQIYQSNISNSNVYYLLEVNETDIIGFASLHIQRLLHHCSNIGEIQEIVVSRKHQYSGLGTALFNRIKEIAANNDCSQLEVCCNQVRGESHKFYCKHGMQNSHYKFTYPLVEKTSVDFDAKE